MLDEVRRVGGHNLLARQRGDMPPQGADCLGMKVCLRFFKGKHRFATGLVQFAQQVVDECLEQEDHRQALNALS